MQPGEYLFALYIVDAYRTTALYASFQQVVPFGSIPLQLEAVQVAASAVPVGKRVNTNTDRMVSKTVSRGNFMLMVSFI
jgi:hypothetical protein